ncbi:MAG TPA: glycerol-3-phosphate 1-O-acyltransferase PlsY [Firmicutes bacterium]|nr:glycerol-3-phosphate 1-O-acyltransferase PlsY [Bacillota bacterium]
MKYILVFAVSYLLGSIPFGLLTTKLFAGVDVRKHGSGNIGMTNVLRTTGYFCALITLIGDMGKGIAAVLLGSYFLGDATLTLISGIMAVVGHNWSLFLRFKGGKGIATIGGVLLAYQPLAAAILAVIWVAVLIFSRYISLASIVVAFCFPMILIILKTNALEVVLAIIVATFTIFKHRSNIERLRNGTEYRFGQKVN